MNTPNQQEPFKFNFKEFISFRQMITLQIIQILYIVVAILITLLALVTMFKGGGNEYAYSMMPGGFLSGIIFLIFGNLGWRVWCELMIVLFRMNKSLGEIENNTRKSTL